MSRFAAVALLLIALASALVALGSVSVPVLPALAQDDCDDGDGSGSDDECEDDHSGHGRGRGRGGDEDEAPVVVTGEVPAGSQVVRILDDDQFTPSTLTVDAGQSITFVNEHDDEHTATGSGFDTGVIPPGGMATVVLDEPGTFAFACQFHPEMTGSIGVRGPDGTVPPPVAATPPPEGGATVEIVDLAFSPDAITVAVGTTVVWTNTGAVPHTVTAADGTFDSGVLDPGASFAHTFTEPGTYAYQCALHPQMQGTVVVEGSDGGAAPPPSPAAQVDAETSEPGSVAVRIHVGDCANPGDAIAELAPATLGRGGEDTVIPVAVSETVVDEALTGLAGGNRAVIVAAASGEPVACGGLGGPVVAAEVVVGLSEIADSGYRGVAVLAEGRSGTSVTVYVSQESAGDLPPPATPAATPVSTAADASVAIVDFAFDQPDLEIEAGTTITWTNTGAAPHTVTADAGAFDSGVLDPGATFSQTFNQPGTFAYFCAIHPEMTGTVVVR